MISRVDLISRKKSWTLNFYITQALTGHGNFTTYLEKMKIIDSKLCIECGIKEGTPWHMLTECTDFRELRAKCGINTESDLSLIEKTDGEVGGFLDYLGKIMGNKRRIV